MMALFIVIIILMSLAEANAGSNSLTSSPQLNGLICPGPIEFTCIGYQVPYVLQWLLNDTVRGTYSFTGDTRPVNISLDPPIPGVIAQATSVHQNGDGLTMNITSTLSGSALILEGSRVQCASLRFTSTSYTVNVIDISPPPSSTSCSLLPSGGPGVSLQWNSSYNSQHTIEMYRVTVTPNLSTCSRDVTPSEDYSCPGLALGTQYTFTVSAINCRNQEGMEYTFTVQPQVPHLLTVEAEPLYDSISQLREVRVHWRNQPPSISEMCFYDRNISYTVVLVSNTGERVDQRTISSDSCTDGLCSTSFSPSSSDQTYHVSVSATNVFGESSSTSSMTFNGSSPFSHLLTFDNCMTSLICSYALSEGQCFIQYGQDPTYQDLNPPIQGPLNSPFTLPLMDENTLYYYLVNNTFGIQFTGNFTTGEFAVKLTPTNQGLLVVGVILLSIATIVGIVLIVVNVKTLIHKGSCLFLIVLVLGCFVIVFSMVLWVAVGFQVRLQKNTCDTNWQSTRDGLIITAFVFSLLSLSYSIIVAVIFAICFKKGNFLQKNSSQQEYYNVSKDIPLDSKRDQVYYEDVNDPNNRKESQSQVSLHQKGIKTARNVVYGINDSKNPNEIKMKPNQVYGVSDQEKEIRIEDKMYDVAESNKYQVSLSHNKIKMKPNMVYGVGQSSDGPEVSTISQKRANLKLKKAIQGTDPSGKEQKKDYVNKNMAVNIPEDESALEYDYVDK